MEANESYMDITPKWSAHDYVAHLEETAKRRTELASEQLAEMVADARRQLEGRGPEADALIERLDRITSSKIVQEA